MSINFRFSELWTYNINIPPNRRELAEKNLSIELLNEKEYTHIHGDLTIEINNRILPKIGYSPADVCFEYWIEAFENMFRKFDLGLNSYKIEGMEQGMPAYLFEKQGQLIYLSIVNSINGGKADPGWQRIAFNYNEFKNEYERFRQELLKEIESKAPTMLKMWRDKFSKTY